MYEIIEVKIMTHSQKGEWWENLPAKRIELPDGRIPQVTAVIRTWIYGWNKLSPTEAEEIYEVRWNYEGSLQGHYIQWKGKENGSNKTQFT